MPDDMAARKLPTGGQQPRWATDINEPCSIAPAGDVVRPSNTTVDAARIRKLVSQRGRHSVAGAPLERPDGLIIEAAFAAGIKVVVATVRQVMNPRGCAGSADNTDDRFDAFVPDDTRRIALLDP